MPRAASRPADGGTGATEVGIETASGSGALVSEDGKRHHRHGRARASIGTRSRLPSRSDTKRIELQIGPIDEPACIAAPCQCRQSALHVVRRRSRGARPCPLRADDRAPSAVPRARQHLVRQVTVDDSSAHAGLGARRRHNARLRHGACAAAVAATRRGLTGRKVTVKLPGGDLLIEWREDDDHVLMTGPRARYEGTLPAEIFTGDIDLQVTA